MLRSFSTPAVSHFRCLPLPSGGQVSRSASAPCMRGSRHGHAAYAARARSAGPGRLLHEGGVVLARGCPYCTRSGPSWSTPECLPVAPDPRAVPAGAMSARSTSPRPSRARRRPTRCEVGLEGSTGVVGPAVSLSTMWSGVRDRLGCPDPLAPQPAVTLKAPTRPAIPAARSSIILASWRRVRQFSGMPLRPYSAPASCP